MATAARLAAEPTTRPPVALTEVPDLAWTAGEWVEVERAPLAAVIDLDQYREPRTVTPGRALSDRRVARWSVVLACALLLGTTAGGRLADAGPADRVAGQTVVVPGETLWDVAVANAPDGIEPGAYLAAIRELNDLDAGAVPAWTVVLLPHG